MTRNMVYHNIAILVAMSVICWATQTLWALVLSVFIAWEQKEDSHAD